MKVNRSTIAVLLIGIMSLAACNLPGSAQDNLNKSVSETLTAVAQNAPAILPSDTPLPTFAEPTATLELETSTPETLPTAALALPSATPNGTYFVVDVGANCRFGPATNYDKITSFQPGTYLTLVGHNPDNTWWYILVGNTNCWISGTTGHTTGSLSALPLITAPPTPTSVTGAGPTLGDPTALVAELSYPSNCTNNTFTVAIRATDAGNGINSVWLSYRYQGDGGYNGSWHTVAPNNNASGGVNGFTYAIGAEAASELGTQNGTFQYQFFAKDNLNNTSSYPTSGPLSIPIKYCP